MSHHMINEPLKSILLSTRQCPLCVQAVSPMRLLSEVQMIRFKNVNEGLDFQYLLFVLLVFSVIFRGTLKSPTVIAGLMNLHFTTDNFCFFCFIHVLFYIYLFNCCDGDETQGSPIYQVTTELSPSQPFFFFLAVLEIKPRAS